MKISAIHSVGADPSTAAARRRSSNQLQLTNHRHATALSGECHDYAKLFPTLDAPGQRVTTVQFIASDGAKKNILGGQVGGASHRIATGRVTWVCEGIATAMSVKAALNFLGHSATVLSAFSASNVANVAGRIPGAVIAADHDKPVDTFGGLGTGEYYARRSGLKWVMPPAPGDWNDYHQLEGLRAVAMQLREVSDGS